MVLSNASAIISYFITEHMLSSFGTTHIKSESSFQIYKGRSQKLCTTAICGDMEIKVKIFENNSKIQFDINHNADKGIHIVMGVMKMGNTMHRAGLEPTSLAFRASELPLHHVGFPDITTIHTPTCLCSSLP